MIIRGLKFRRELGLMWIRAVATAVRRHGLLGSVVALRRLQVFVGAIRQQRSLQKLARVGKRFAFDIYCPAFPSPAAERFIEQELRRHVDRGSGNVLQTAIVAITKECPLRCEHCCEWDNLNHAETLSRDDLRSIVRSLRERGVTQIFFSGGEPLRRLTDLLHASEDTPDALDCWIITSGVGLTAAGARQLGEARFTGLVISVDHWSAERHDAFRGRHGAFDAAMTAAAHARSAGLAVALSLCPSREFTTRENLERYAALASSVDAAFIQIMEPRAVGHYAGRDVLLAESELQTLEAFHDGMNFDPRNALAPIVTYPALYQRRFGCLGAAERYLYLDTNGDVHACPFCRHSAGNIVRDGLERTVLALKERGCPTG